MGTKVLLSNTPPSNDGTSILLATLEARAGPSFMGPEASTIWGALFKKKKEL